MLIIEADKTLGEQLGDNPTATTQDIADNSDRIATTKFIKDLIVDSLDDNSSDKILSAKQGSILKNMLDSNRIARVDTFDDLPDAGDNADKYFIVKTTTGVIGSRKLAGLYLSDGTDWARLSRNQLKAYDTDLFDGHDSSYFATEISVTNKATLKVQYSNEMNIAEGFDQDNGVVFLNYRGTNKPISQLVIRNGRNSDPVRLSNIAHATEDNDVITLKQYKELKQGSSYSSLQEILDKDEWIGNGRYKIVNAEGRPSEVYCVKDDDTGNIYMVVGKFADGAHDTVAETIPTRDEVIDNSSGTVFSSNYGEQICQEVRFVGVTNIEGDWKSGRQLDFSHLIPANRKWKHTFTSGQESGMPRVGRNGYAVTGMHNYLNDWENDKTSFHRISDNSPTITAKAFIQEGSFYLDTAQDAKFTIAYDVEQVGQDSNVSAGFGRDDNHRFSFEDNQTNTNNVSVEKIDFSTAVYVLIR